MRFSFRTASATLVVAWLSGCSGPGTEQETLGHTQQAANVCSETVPTNRVVDGIPAYAQCATTTGAIYSNNGVDTATASAGTGWVRTQMSGGYQCTELAHRYLYFRWNVSWLPTGDAGLWCDKAPASNSGVVQSTTPVHGDLIVFAPGSCGADSTTGHVALVDVVNATTVTIVEENSAGRRNTATTCAKCFLHVVANTGSGGAGGAPGTGGTTPTAGAGTNGGVANTGGSRAADSSNATGGSPIATGGVGNVTGGAANTGGSSSGNFVPQTGGASSSTSTVADTPATGGANVANSTTGGASTNSSESAGAPTEDPARTNEAEGCGCRVPGGGPARLPGLAKLGLLGLLLMGRRRREHCH